MRQVHSSLKGRDLIMNLELPSETLRALPVQVIAIEGGVILKRGRVEVRIVGEESLEAVQTLLDAAAGTGVTKLQLEKLFALNKCDVVQDLVEHLIRRRFLVPVPDDAPEPKEAESAADVFYWQFGTSERQVLERLNRQRIFVLGVNLISSRLVDSLSRSKVSFLEVLDVPELRNLDMFDKAGVPLAGIFPADPPVPIHRPEDEPMIDPEGFDCLVATSDRGGLALLSKWNEYCHLHKRLFLPVILQDSIGYVGPLVVPGETACLECFRSRRLTHVPDPGTRRLMESATSINGGVPGFLIPMASYLGDIAAMELMKFLGIGPRLGRVGIVIEVNPMAPSMVAHPVLRLPRCPVCTPLGERPLISSRSEV